jgi:hypothetical protein
VSGVLRQVTATRYVTPLREGGSLPAVVEADDLGTYVVKFRGAGQGLKALIAEVISGELARRLGLPVPELVVTELDPVVARAEPDEEVQALIKASAGVNLGMDFLPGSLGFDPVAHPVDAGLASRTLVFDAFVENVDRSWRNPNLLIWHGGLWLIDHGATLYFHHTPGWESGPDRSQDAFPLIKNHVLLSAADALAEADAALSRVLTPDAIAQIVAAVPDAWLEADTSAGAAPVFRDAYVRHLLGRLQAPRRFFEEAVRAR